MPASCELGRNFELPIAFGISNRAEDVVDAGVSNAAQLARLDSSSWPVAEQRALAEVISAASRTTGGPKATSSALVPVAGRPDCPLLETEVHREVT